MHDCLTGFLAEKGIDMAGSDVRFIWRPESSGNDESGHRIDLRAIDADPFIIEPDSGAEPGSVAGEGPRGGGGAQRGQGNGEGEVCTRYTLTPLGAVCAEWEGGQGGNGHPVVLTSATATISSSLSASSVASNGTFTATVSTTGAGSKSSGGVNIPQASSFVSSGQKGIGEWAVGLLVVLATLGSFL